MQIRKHAEKKRALHTDRRRQDEKKKAKKAFHSVILSTDFLFRGSLIQPPKNHSRENRGKGPFLFCVPVMRRLLFVLILMAYVHAAPRKQRQTDSFVDPLPIVEYVNVSNGTLDFVCGVTCDPLQDMGCTLSDFACGCACANAGTPSSPSFFCGINPIPFGFTCPSGLASQCPSENGYTVICDNLCCEYTLTNTLPSTSPTPSPTVTPTHSPSPSNLPCLLNFAGQCEAGVGSGCADQITNGGLGDQTICGCACNSIDNPGECIADPFDSVSRDAFCNPNDPIPCPPMAGYYVLCFALPKPLGNMNPFIYGCCQYTLIPAPSASQTPSRTASSSMSSTSAPSQSTTSAPTNSKTSAPSASAQPTASTTSVPTSSPGTTHTSSGTRAPGTSTTGTGPALALALALALELELEEVVGRKSM